MAVIDGLLSTIFLEAVEAVNGRGLLVVERAALLGGSGTLEARPGIAVLREGDLMEETSGVFVMEAKGRFWGSAG